MDTQPKLSSFHIGMMITVAIIGDVLTWLLGLILLGWLSSFVFLGLIFPLWFYLAGVKYTLNDVWISLGMWVISFIPIASWLPEITAKVVEKVLVVKFKDQLQGFAGKAIGKIAKSKLFKYGTRIAEVVAPEAAPVIEGVRKGVQTASKIESANRTAKKFTPWGERTPKAGTLPGDKPTRGAQVAKARVGQEIRGMGIPSPAL